MTAPRSPLVESLLSHADAQPDQPAIVAPAETLSYGDFAKRVLTAAARIGRVIGSRGERVVLCGPNSPQLAAAYFAVHAAGGVAVLLDAATPAETLRWVVEDAEPRLVLCGAALPSGSPSR